MLIKISILSALALILTIQEASVAPVTHESSTESSEVPSVEPTTDSSFEVSSGPGDFTSLLPSEDVAKETTTEPVPSAEPSLEPSEEPSEELNGETSGECIGGEEPNTEPSEEPTALTSEKPFEEGEQTVEPSIKPTTDSSFEVSSGPGDFTSVLPSEDVAKETTTEPVPEMTN